MPASDSFLPEFRRRHWSEDTDIAGLTPHGYFTPASGRALEVAVARADEKPTRESVRRLWRARHHGRAAGVLLVVIYPGADGDERAEVVGLYDEEQVADLELTVVERRLAEALDAAAASEARELLTGLFEISDGGVQGLRNKGLFASHALEVNTPRRSDWPAAGAAARAARGTRGGDLLRALGWAITPAGGDLLLRPKGRERDRAVAVLLEGDEVFDRPTLRYGLGVSPVEHGLEVARQQELPWVLAVRGTTVRLYASDPDVGVTRTGAASFTELTIDLLDDDHVAYAWLLLTPHALDVDGTADEILRDSREHATSLGERLRERVYRDVIPNLSETIASKLGKLDEKGLDEAYHHTLVVLFRLLFVAYAEDRGLLPYGLRTPAGAVYTRVALKTRAIGYAEQLREGALPRYDGHATDVWDDLTSIWDGVYHGHLGWGVPEYGGTLFRQDSTSGHAIARITLSNKEIEPALVALLVDTGRDGTLGPVDFQALSVREFGTIYEGLLESSLSLAPVDLALDKSQAYVPAKPGDEVVVPAGKVYFHNASGARKATGSYFTKEFAVEHLLETALDPTLAEHLDRVAALLDDGKEGDAAEALFDFRVADIAMGSGHFLVAAVDHLAAGISGFLDRRPVPEVRAELDRIRSVAFDKLAAVGVGGADAPEITHEALLRRQVARRCVYGVDINEIAVDLARLALWIHTFVPGLPMSSLDHGLVHGNSLTGIGTVDEALDALEPERVGGMSGVQSLFGDAIAEAIAATGEPLARAARISEVSVAETLEAESLAAEAAAAVAPVAWVFDAIVAVRAGVESFDLRLAAAQGWDRLVETGERPDVREVVAVLRPVHFPVAFPEAFRPGRARTGFDVILGNPPWEEATVEEDKFWGMHDPHLRASSSADSSRRIEILRQSRPDLVEELKRRRSDAARYRSYLLAGPYPGMGTGDPDLYKAFCWRFSTLVRHQGRIGVVLPRSPFATKGSAPWRVSLLPSAATTIYFTVNEKEWLFTDVNPGWPVALVTAQVHAVHPELRVAGPYRDRSSFERSRASGPIEIPLDRLTEVDPLMCVPVVDSDNGLGLFVQLITHPSVGSSRSDFDVRPTTELHATNDGKKRFFTDSASDWPVFNHLNVGHFRFEPEVGAFNFVDRSVVTGELQRRRLSTYTRSDSPFRGMTRDVAIDPSTLPAQNPRILIRDVVHSSNPRKIWAALAPAETLLTNTAPYLYFAAGTAKAQSYLLGILNSAVCDWFGHLRISLHFNFFIFNSVPVPVFDEGDERCVRLSELSGRLALASAGDYGAWSSFGHPIDEPAVRAESIAELDAIASLLYGLTDVQLELVFDMPTRSSISSVRRYRDKWSTGEQA